MHDGSGRRLRPLVAMLAGLVTLTFACSPASTEVRNGFYVVYAPGGGVAPDDLTADLAGADLYLAAGGESAQYALGGSEATFQVCAQSSDEQAVLLLDPPSVLLPGIMMVRAALHGPCIDGEPYLIHLVDLAVTDDSSPLRHPQSVALCQETAEGCPLGPTETTAG
jgi:hypothetical protein